MYDILQLNDKLVTELKEIAQNLGVKGIAKFSKQDLIYKILDEQALAEKNAANRIVPIVEEPNPQTGRRARKVKTSDEEESPKAEEPAAPPVKAPKLPPVRKERASEPPPARVQEVNRPVPEPKRDREQPRSNQDNNRNPLPRRDDRQDRRDQGRNNPNDNRREQQPRPEGQNRSRDRWEDRRDRRQREWEDRRRERLQPPRPGQPGLFDSDAARLQNLEEDYVAPVNPGEDDEEMVPMHRPFAPLAVGQPEPVQDQPKQTAPEPVEVMPPTVHKERFDVELDGIVEGLGTLEMMPDGYGFL
ncbi:MAG TPA: hypothetical protein DCF33_07070, partial [Saprospirales bacterium]|nr:hypothetical protein [Saprospirales bacterium]